MEFKGTKGEWHINKIDLSDYKQIAIFSENKKSAICLIYIHDNYTIDTEKEANAQLISCAPEMLEMIKLLVDRMEENDLGQFSAVKRAKELIEKATNI